MTLLQTLFHLTNFRNPFLRTLVPCVSAAFAIQAAFAVPSIAAQSERFYDVSGSLTYLAVTALSLYLPALRARFSSPSSTITTTTTTTTIPTTGFHWRQLVLSAAVALWTARLGTHLFQRIRHHHAGRDSRFDPIRADPPRFLAAFAAQASWVSLCLLPVVAVNAAPAAALPAAVRPLDALGLALFVAGLAVEVVADAQKAAWARERRDKVHDEPFLTRGLWSWSRHPNYFGESTLWTGLATVSAGILLHPPVAAALALPPVAALALCYTSPAFVTFLLLKVSGVPLSEAKYDRLYGHRRDYQEWKRNTPMYIPKLW